jgi:hypothetical protein
MREDRDYDRGFENMSDGRAFRPSHTGTMVESIEQSLATLWQDETWLKLVKKAKRKPPELTLKGTEKLLPAKRVGPVLYSRDMHMKAETEDEESGTL